MISIFLVTTIACYTSFEELANTLGLGYYAISYTPGAAPKWNATMLLSGNFTELSSRAYCSTVDLDNCFSFDEIPEGLKYGYTYPSTVPICNKKSAAETASAYMYAFHTDELPSLYYIAGCAVGGKGLEEENLNPAKCGSTNTHPLSALQGIVDNYPLTDSCYSIPTTAAAPKCAKPSRDECTDDHIYEKYIADFKVVYASKGEDEQIMYQIRKFGPVLAKLNMHASDDLQNTQSFDTARGLYCAKGTAQSGFSEWVELVGYGKEEITFDEVTTSLCGTPQSAGTVQIPYIIARSQYNVDYFSPSKEPTFFKIPLSYERDSLTLTDPIKDADSGEVARYSGFFLATFKWKLPQQGEPPKLLQVGDDKIVRTVDFIEADYIKLKPEKVSEATFSHWTPEELKANEQASQLHSETNFMVPSSKFTIDAVYLTAQLHGASLSGVASVAGTVGTYSTIGAGDNMNFLKAHPTSKKYDPSALDIFTQYGLSDQGLVLASCLPEKLDDFYASTTTQCVAGNGPVTRVATGFQSVHAETLTVADVKKYIACYGPVISYFKWDTAALGTFLANRGQVGQPDTFVFEPTDSYYTAVIIVGWGEYTPEGSNPTPHTSWYVKLSGQGCTNCGKDQQGIFIHITKEIEAPLPLGVIAFVKNKNSPGPEPDMAFFTFPPLQSFLIIASFLLLLLLA